MALNTLLRPSSTGVLDSASLHHHVQLQCPQSLVYGFHRLGYTVGCHPGWTIVVILVVAGLSAGGFLLFRQSRDNNLWVPTNADALKHKRWVDKYFPETARYSSIILMPTEGINVLSPKVLQEVRFGQPRKLATSL